MIKKSIFFPQKITYSRKYVEGYPGLKIQIQLLALLADTLSSGEEISTPKLSMHLWCYSPITFFVGTRQRVFVMQGTVIPKLNIVMSAGLLQNGISLQILETPFSLPTFNIVNFHLESSFRSPDGYQNCMARILPDKIFFKQ